MSDIFLSYAADDRDRVRPVVERLHAEQLVRLVGSEDSAR